MERQFMQVALFAALIAALGLVPPINLASGVPITAQSLGVMLAGTALGAKRGFAATALFIVLTLVGLPLLSGGRGGIGVLASPTAGFVIGFPIAAFVTGFITERLGKMPLAFAGFLGATLGGIVVLYAFGVTGMSLKLEKSLPEAALLLTPYLPGDFIKAALAGMITAAVYRARPSAIYSRA